MAEKTALSLKRRSREIPGDVDEEQGLQKEDAVKKLAAMTVFYKTMPDFLRDLVLAWRAT